MTFVPDRAEHDGHRTWSLPAEDLNTQVRNVLGHAVYAHQKNLKVYESLRNLNEVVGTEYSVPQGRPCNDCAPGLMSDQT